MLFSTTSVEKSIFCLFYCFFFALASILTARFNRRSIKETKNALFHYERGKKHSLFVLLLFFCARFNFNRSLQSKINKRDKECSFPLRAWKKAFFVCFIAFFLRSLQSKINKRNKESSFFRS